MAKNPRPPTHAPDVPPLASEAATGGDNAKPIDASVLALAHTLSSGHTRALLVTHVPAEGETYDKGRRYEVRMLEAKDGAVTLREVVEVDGGEQTLSMPFHVALSHAEREFAAFLKPEMFR